MAFIEDRGDIRSDPIGSYWRRWLRTRIPTSSSSSSSDDDDYDSKRKGAKPILTDCSFQIFDSSFFEGGGKVKYDSFIHGWNSEERLKLK